MSEIATNSTSIQLGLAPELFGGSFEQFSESKKSGLTRTVSRRDGSIVTSSVGVREDRVSTTLSERYDLAWLTASKKPRENPNGKRIRIADLFSGCGGLSLGVAEASRALGLLPDHAFASEMDPVYMEVYENNFHPAWVERGPIEALLDGELGARLSASERTLRKKLEGLTLVAGGPPCQGHSDLNNHTRRDDPKNKLFERMARFAEVTRPDHIIIENVPGVRHDKGGSYFRTIAWLSKLGYQVAQVLLEADKFGVPQRRRRAFVLASKKTPLNQERLASDFARMKVPPRPVRWACNDLLGLESDHPIDQHSELSAESKLRVDWLFENNSYDLPDDLRPDCHRTKKHTYKSVYGRLYWDQPSWTITTGFAVMGQGRFLHPLKRRVISAHEAARLQFFPDWFDFGTRSRKEYSKMIGNAVPSKLAYAVAMQLLR